MPDEDIEELDSPNQPTEEVDETTTIEESTPEEETEDVEQLKEKNQKLYERAKKAEAEAKLLKAKQQPVKEQVSTPSDTRSAIKQVMDAKAILDLEEEDAEFVINYADKFGLGIAAARKNKDVQAILSVRAEERRTAATTSTSGTRRGTSKVSDETLLDNAERGNMPDSDADLMRLAQARLQRMKS